MRAEDAVWKGNYCLHVTTYKANIANQVVAILSAIK